MDERRRANDQKIDSLCEKIDQVQKDISDINLNVALIANKVEANHKSMRESVDRNYQITERHERILYGNGNVGVTSKIREIETLNNELKSHTIQDRWMFGILITMFLFVLGKIFIN